MAKKKIRVYTNFKFEDDDYTFGNISNLTHYSEKEYREEYMRLYKVAKSRVRTFESAGMTREAAYKSMKTLKPQSKLDLAELARSIVAVRKALKAEGGTVSGAQVRNARKLQELHNLGYDWVDNDNLYDFFEFMSKMRNSAYRQIYGYERMVDIFETSVEEGYDTHELFEEFENFMSQREKMGKRTATKEEIKDFQKWQEQNYS